MLAIVFTHHTGVKPAPCVKAGIAGGLLKLRHVRKWL